VGWVAVEICVLIAVLVVFNVFPDRLGVYGSATDPDSFMPLLADEFQAHMPWLNIWWGSSLALAMGRLMTRRWTKVLRWADLALRLFGVAVLVRLITGGPLVDPTSGWDGLGWLEDPNVGIKALLGLVLLPTAIGILQRLVGLGKAYATTGR
jgi:hypothetical protein